MKAYIGTKIIAALPMTRKTFEAQYRQNQQHEDKDDEHGYVVRYPEGYVSWSPKRVFEASYREVTEDEKDNVNLSFPMKAPPEG